MSNTQMLWLLLSLFSKMPYPRLCVLCHLLLIKRPARLLHPSGSYSLKQLIELLW